MNDATAQQQCRQLCALAQQARGQGQLQQAVNLFQQASRLCPQSPVPYEGLLEMLLERGELASAATVFSVTPPALLRQSLALQALQARLLLLQEKFAAARQRFEQLESIVTGRDRARVYFNEGWCDVGLGDLPRALESFRKAQAAGMDDAAPWISQGSVLQRMGDLAGAEALYAAAAERFPDNSDLRYEEALLHLRQGRYAEGFRLFHHRLRARAAGLANKTIPPIPAWDGQRVARLLVLGEQGLGDQLVYSALLPGVAALVDSVGVAFDPRLTVLLQRSFPALRFLDANGRSVAEISRDFDAYAFAGDLGAASVASIGGQQRLQPDAARVAALREQYRDRFPGKRLVGISWKSPKAKTAGRKSIPLLQWRAILEAPDCHFISLQYGEVDNDLRQVQEQFGIAVHADPDIDSIASIDGLAAQSAALDQVITVSNTTAHIAAAVGTPTAVLLPPHDGLFWYWGARGEHTPWYPAARLFRAQRDGHWDDALAASAQLLRTPA